MERAGVEQPLDRARGPCGGPDACWRATRSSPPISRGERLAPAQLVELGLPAHAAVASQAMWSNWSRGQTCAPAEHVRPGEPGRAGRGRRPRARRARGGRRPLVLRRRRRPTGRCCRSSALDRVLDVDRATRARARRGRHPRCTALVRELHGHGLALPNLGDIDVQSLAGALVDRHARDGRAARQPRLAASRRWSSCSPTARERGRRRRRRAARRARRARRARSRRGGHAALRARLPPARRRPRRCRSTTCSTASTSHVDGQRPLRAVHVPALAAGADAHQQPHRRAAARRGGRGSSGCRTSRWTTTRSGCSTARRGARRGRSRASTARPAAPPPSASAWRSPSTSSPARGSCASRRWSTRCRGRAPPRRCGRAREILARHPGLVPDRAALLGRRRRAALARARARDGVRRRARLRGDGVRGARSARSRRCCASWDGRPHWGKRSFLARRGAGAALPALGRLRGDPRAPRSRTGASSTPGSRARSAPAIAVTARPALDPAAVCVSTALLLINVAAPNVALEEIAQRPRRVLHRPAVGAERLRARARRLPAHRGLAGRPVRAQAAVRARAVPLQRRLGAVRAGAVGGAADRRPGAAGARRRDRVPELAGAARAGVRGRRARGARSGSGARSIGLAFAAGPLVGGLLVDAFGWQAIFVLGVVLGLPTHRASR